MFVSSVFNLLFLFTFSHFSVSLCRLSAQRPCGTVEKVPEHHRELWVSALVQPLARLVIWARPRLPFCLSFPTCRMSKASQVSSRVFFHSAALEIFVSSYFAFSGSSPSEGTARAKVGLFLSPASTFQDWPETA